jgi:serine/threonine protein kinase
LEKVKSQELREFITQCIAHDPDSRPDTRQLLKHPFFESIRTGKVQVERGTTLADRPSEDVQVRGGRGCQHWYVVWLALSSAVC